MSYNGNIFGLHLYGALFTCMVFIRCLERDNHWAMAIILIAVGLAHLSYQSDVSDSFWGAKERSMSGVMLSLASVVLSTVAAFLVIFGA